MFPTHTGRSLPCVDMHEALLDLEVTPHDKHNIKLLDNVHPADWKNPTNTKYSTPSLNLG
jgi:hypothetical protein